VKTFGVLRCAQDDSKNLQQQKINSKRSTAKDLQLTTVNGKRSATYNGKDVQLTTAKMVGLVVEKGRMAVVSEDLRGSFPSASSGQDDGVDTATGSTTAKPKATATKAASLRRVISRQNAGNTKR
jgi:hypothetical protein